MKRIKRLIWNICWERAQSLFKILKYIIFFLTFGRLPYSYAGVTKIQDFVGFHSSGSYRLGPSYHGELYFIADDGKTGYELWALHGKDIRLLKDINPTGNAFPYADRLIVLEPLLFVYQDRLYFIADDGTHGSELWFTSGTSETTSLLKDIFPGKTGSFPLDFTLYHDKLYFVAKDEPHGVELWESDGTSQGTSLAKDIFPGEKDSFPFDLTVYNNELYFQAKDETRGFELLAFDGTHIRLVKDINPTGDSLPHHFTMYKNKLYFFADDGTHGNELWVSDGTTEGTHLLKEISPGKDASLYGLTPYKDKLYFSATDEVHGYELWGSDGTAEGTVLVKDINPTGDANLYFLTVYRDQLYFNATEGTLGYELWVGDGNHFQVFTDSILPGPKGSDPLYLTPENDQLYWVAKNESDSFSLWRYEPILPTITTHPSSQTLFAPQSVTLTVIVVGDEPINYQWYQGVSGERSLPLVGANSAMLTTPVLESPTSYWVEVSNHAGKIESQTANLTWANSSNQRVTQPASQTIVYGYPTTLNVVANEAVSYQWYQGPSGETSHPILGATEASFTTSPITVTTQYWVRMMTAYQDSDTATITVTQPPQAPVLLPPTVPLCPVQGSVNEICHAEGQRIEQLEVKEQGNLSHGIVVGTLTNRGWVSNLTVKGTLLGGMVTGYIDNQGIMRDFTFVGATIDGGTLGGRILNQSQIGGYFQDVTLEAHSHLSGGILKGRIIGDPNAPALLEDLKVKTGSHLSGVKIGQGVKLEEGSVVEEFSQLTFPHLGTNATDLQGHPVEVNTQITGGASLNGRPFQVQMVTQTLANALDIQGEMVIDPTHVHQEAILFMTLAYQEAEESEISYFKLDTQKRWIPWNQELANLLENSWQSQITLTAKMPIKVSYGLLLGHGKVNLHFGYVLKENLFVQNQEGIEMTVAH